MEASRHLAALTAQHFGRTVDVDVLPDFPLYKEQAVEQTPPPVVPSDTEGETDEPAEEGDDAPQAESADAAA